MASAASFFDHLIDIAPNTYDYNFADLYVGSFILGKWTFTYSSFIDVCC